MTRSHFSRAEIHFEKSLALHHRMGFASDRFPDEVFLDEFEESSVLGWGSVPWGSSPWGSNVMTPSRSISSVVPRRFQRAAWLSLIYEHAFAAETFAIAEVSIATKPISQKGGRKTVLT